MLNFTVRITQVSFVVCVHLFVFFISLLPTCVYRFLLLRFRTFVDFCDKELLSMITPIFTFSRSTLNCDTHPAASVNLRILYKIIGLYSVTPFFLHFLLPCLSFFTIRIFH